MTMRKTKRQLSIGEDIWTISEEVDELEFDLVIPTDSGRRREDYEGFISYKE
jgi:hypothetical protein